MNPITIAHLSDIHYAPKEISQVANMLREKNIYVENLLPQCLEHLKTVNPDIILITGDLTHESDAEDFRYVKETLHTYMPETPVLCTIGNHDIRHAFRTGFLNLPDHEANDEPYYDSVIVNDYQFVSLDSSYVNGLKGIFTDEAMDYLEKKLENPNIAGTFILMHHPIMKRARHLAFDMNERLEQILRTGKIKGIFNGHVHSNFTSSVFGIPQFTSESLKTDFDVLSDRLSYNDRSGYQIVTFDENGDFLAERLILNPKPEILVERMYKK
ncbi:MAG: metallophosphoesterase [Lachnospiraceae bacterium]|nr:metallophosphoesterase [Lachnospiraceae bacterium]